MVRTRFGLPVMKALPIETRDDLSPVRLYANVADRLIFDARPPREATRPGGLGKTFRLESAGRTRSRRAVHAVGRARYRKCRRGVAHHTCARRSMCRQGSNARPATRIRTRFALSSRCRARRGRRGYGKGLRARHDRPAAQLLPHRSRRARAFRHLRRPLCRRDADAADPRPGEGLCRGQGRSGIQGARWTAI